MADSDPRKIRPLAQPADRQSFDGEEDPLVELARIVSADSGFYGSKQKPTLRSDEPIDRNALSADLEAELLQELESSFAPRSPAPPSRASAPPRQEPTADNADDLLRSIEAQLGEFERRAQTSRGAPDHTAAAAINPDASAPQEASPYTIDPLDSAALAADSPAGAAPRAGGQDPAPAVKVGSEETELPARPLPTRFAARLGRAAEAAANKAAAPPVGRRQAPAASDGGRGTPAADQPGSGIPQPDASESPESRFSAAPALRSERDSTSDGTPNLPGVRTTFGSLEHALQPAAQAEPAGNVEAGLTRELEPSYADPTFGGHWQDATEESLSDEPRIASSDEVVAPVAARAPSHLRLATVAGIVAVVVLGAGVAAYVRSGDTEMSAPPPLVAAEEGPVKVAAPSQPAAEDGTVGEAVYDRVAGNAPPAEEQVIDSAEEPREISRIVLPPTGSETDPSLAREVGPDGAAPAGINQNTSNSGAAAPGPVQSTPGSSVGSPPGDQSTLNALSGSAAGEQGTAETEAASEPVGPRRVRTYVVRPDGTIVTTGEAAASSPSPAEQELAMPAAPIDPVRVQTTSVDELGRPQDQPGTEAPPVVVAEAGVPGPVSDEAQPPPELDTAAPPEQGAAPVEEQTAAVEPAEVAPPPRASEDEAASAPAETAAVSASPADDPAAPTAEGHFVQLSSQRDEAQAQASFSTMQSRYPEILGGMQPNIQRADLGAKGIYYRARVGPYPTRPDAIEVCERLKAAGGTCLVTR